MRYFKNNELGWPFYLAICSIWDNEMIVIRIKKKEASFYGGITVVFLYYLLKVIRSHRREPL